MRFIQFFDAIRLSDIATFGGKNASLGEMTSALQSQGIRVPYGFATTVEAYYQHIHQNNLLPGLKAYKEKLYTYSDIDLLEKVASEMRELIINAPFPKEIQTEIVDAYRQLSKKYAILDCDVAVRSSATSEDLPEASFAGQQETYLHVQGLDELLQACKRCMASLFTARALVYRKEHDIDDFEVGISVGVQKMVQSENACSGIAFTLDTESGFPDVITITSSYGLGELIVQGRVNPDEFCVHKSLLKKGYAPLIRKKLGTKEQKLVYVPTHGIQDSRLEIPFRQGNFESLVALEHPPLKVALQEVAEKDRMSFSLRDDEIFELARYATLIENYYSQLHGRWSPMDIEWAKDSGDGLLYIVQARPETVQRNKQHDVVVTYSFIHKPLQKDLIITGQSVGNSIVSGTVRVIHNLEDAQAFQDGDILVARMTDPDWVPLMKRAAALITDQGGRMCHAAIVSRELSIPAVIATEQATQLLRDGQTVTIDCSNGLQGSVYQGEFAFTRHEDNIRELAHPPIDVMVNVGNPESAFALSFLPVKGVGLARLEFVISSMIKVHPMAIVQPNAIDDPRVKEEIQRLAAGYNSAPDYYVNVLAQSIGMIAGAFYPRPVIVRLTDFKSNEYRDLVGGSYFEPQEENPMLGFRGAVRYRSKEYGPAFALECEALKKAREVMGFENIKIMVPFVRTVAEAAGVVELLKENGLVRARNGLELLMMVEIPSNVILLEKFAKYFDGFSIGSNDLTQLTLGIDRDSGILTHVFDERDEAVQEMMRESISKARSLKKPIGICGQAPSDFPELAHALIAYGITSISLLPDSVLSFLKKG